MALLLLLHSCTSNICDNTPNYRSISAELNKNYQLTSGDLIVTYDLGNIDHSNCIYAQDLGLITNDNSYVNKYLKKFKKNYKSKKVLRKEATKKVIKISRLLIALDKRYHILSNNKSQYVKKLAKADLTKLDVRKELKKLDRIIAYVPLMSPEYHAQISSKYGYRFHPIKRKKQLHCGIDLITKPKGEIYAAACGRVTFVGKKNGYGLVVEINHSRKVKTRYAHLDKIHVKKGARIGRGQVIGKQGSSGRVTNEHLHFEILIRNRTVNPHNFIGNGCKCWKRGAK
ncbi:MAG: M23 family metallopeptidase [Rickettsiaceae bacterium]|nr:M23 family metallopeptidase [Rickettsiaceae bacterium]